MTDSTDRALSLDGVQHFFGATRALEQVTLNVTSGEFIALLGPSGCGKTTLLQIIAGFLTPSAGAVWIDGQRVESVPANRRNVGMVFQSYALFPHMSVFENVAYGLKARSGTKERIKTKVADMLDLVQMSRFALRKPGELSGGQQQRVALARALAIEPSIMLLDEPFSALDKNLRLDMQIEIKSLLKGYGVTSIMVTHDQEEALSMADRIVVMNKGRIEQTGTPDALYDKPDTLFVNTFIGHANLLQAQLVTADRIDLAAGVTWPLTTPSILPPGPVLASVRPENLHLCAPDTTSALAAIVRAVLPLGGTEIIEAVTQSGDMLKVIRPRSGSAPRVAPGEAISLALNDPAAIGLFPPPPQTTGDTA